VDSNRAAEKSSANEPQEKRDSGPRRLRPSTRPFFVTLGLGAAVGVAGTPHRLKIQQDFGWHFLDRSTGPAVGISFQESFGTGYLLKVGPKFWWDFAIAKDLGLYIGPTAEIGAFFGSADGQRLKGMALHLGAEARLTLGDRFVITCRPVSFDFGFGSGGFSLRVDVFVVGGGVSF
jgi:hypothetical protein